jgi:hypothetical protein
MVDRGPLQGIAAERGSHLKFTIRYRNIVLARAAGSLLTLRDRQTIEVMQDADPEEFFTAIVMVCLHLDHLHEKRRKERAGKE